MAKHCIRNSTIEIKEPSSSRWVSIADLVTSWSYQATIGELASIELTLFHDSKNVQFDEPRKVDNGARQLGIVGGWGNHRIAVRGVDVSENLAHYSIVRTPGDFERLVLTLYCDKYTLRINGTHFWEPLAIHVRDPEVAMLSEQVASSALKYHPR